MSDKSMRRPGAVAIKGTDMDRTGENDETTDGGTRPYTTRRRFIAGASLGAVSLYGLWAALGAAPLDFAELEGGEAGAESGGHGEHGGAPTGPTPEEFRRLTDEFIARHGLPDGSVELGPAEMAADDHASHDMAEMDQLGEAAGAGGHDMAAMDMAAIEEPAVAVHAPGAPEVYILAQQWSFEPAMLRLKANVPYRFRMMAVDTGHGASLQLGFGSRIVRLRRNVLTEQTLTFTRPGDYLLYCTVYCGPGHDFMSGRIVIA
jgi:uncharacterized cupredoxin-like copper-binding protein